MARDGFQYRWIPKLRDRILAGYGSNAELAAWCGVSEATFVRWRRTHAALDRECECGLADCITEVTGLLLGEARGGDIGAMKFILERRSPAFTQKRNLDHTSGGRTLDALLAKHGELNEDDARKLGIVMDDDDEDEEGYEDEYDDEDDEDFD